MTHIAQAGSIISLATGHTVNPLDVPDLVRGLEGDARKLIRWGRPERARELAVEALSLFEASVEAREQTAAHAAARRIVSMTGREWCGR